MTYRDTYKRFLLVDYMEDDQKIIIFASDLKLGLLARSKQVVADGTFKSCPKLFKQLYIITGWCKGECIPLAFIFLGGKKENTYRRMISELVDGCRRLSVEWRPQRIILDFENGAISAFRYFFPEAKIIGCFFHFGQCLFRKLVACGLKSAYGGDEKLKLWFKCCVALAFIPKRRLQLIFTEAILDEAPLSEYPRLSEFTDYLLETWIDDDALFPIELWNQHSNADERVNNGNEGYNNRVALRTSTAHPHIWKLIEVIQKEEFLLVQVRSEGLIKGTLKSRGRYR